MAEHGELVYAIHQYPEPGSADGGPYPGETAGRYFDEVALAAEFRSMTEYMREHCAVQKDLCEVVSHNGEGKNP